MVMLELPVLTLANMQVQTIERQVRSDALPEHLDYRDEGCDLFVSCLACPLPRCRYDEPGGVRAMLNRERDHQMRVLRDDAGMTVDEIADHFQVSRRTVFRALATGSTRCAPGRVSGAAHRGERGEWGAR
ncbi:MAG: helix-turn-helix domain-containing protein [Dehalococcoidia bacterium]|nr:helix-turn-helix domain-containing protein [Dehalococcoidia bacterium]